jgi:hypothetical protein
MSFFCHFFKPFDLESKLELPEKANREDVEIIQTAFFVGLVFAWLYNRFLEIRRQQSVVT